MSANRPHYLLYSSAQCPSPYGPRWQFTLQSLCGADHLSASDVEPGTSPNRLELLAVVRGLEALEQPSRVTLLTHSRYVYRGMRRGLNQWRDRQWRWERFGQLVPIRNHDLWQRIDRALQYHELECCRADVDLLPAAASEAHQSTAARPWARDAAPEGFEPHHSGTRAAAACTTPRWATRPPRYAHFEDRHFSNIFYRLRQAVLAPLTCIWRPAFTRAA